MATREATIVVINHTNEELNLDVESQRLNEGEWMAPESLPPKGILAGESGMWRCRAHGIGAGIDGSVTYRVAGGKPSDTVAFGWKIPYIGSNKYSPKSTAEGYRLKVFGGEGNHATVVFLLGKLHDEISR